MFGSPGGSTTAGPSEPAPPAVHVLLEVTTWLATEGLVFLKLHSACLPLSELLLWDRGSPQPRLLSKHPREAHCSKAGGAQRLPRGTPRALLERQIRQPSEPLDRARLGGAQAQECSEAVGCYYRVESCRKE